MKKTMIACALLSLVGTAVTVTACLLWHREWLETLSITAGTIGYHFTMRLFVGAAWSPLEFKINPDAAWYRERRFEAALYRVLRVKRWKHRVPTYAPDTFDPKQHSMEEILLSTCHSERVHETIIALSFVPLIGIRWFGAPLAFILTSVAAALIDGVFVVVQRYNRPRLRRLVKRQQRQSH